ncbi:MAG: hypothetical protein K6G15_12115 [Desulfovibrio sp.]|nr:hypothetical protein [Desulfovibrio sp.]
MLRCLCLALCLFQLCACSKLPARELAQNLGQARGFHEVLLKCPPFTLFSLIKEGQGSHLTVYLEGDGHAYDRAFEPAQDPTPHYPCALKLALHDPAKNPICYLARPGQYLDRSQYPCEQRFWTTERMSPSVLCALNQALDQAKALTRANRLVLVGYSGGGGLCALLAQNRQDVDFLASVAGNLYLDCWLSEKQLSPLTDALDPYTRAHELGRLAQRHFLGSEDQIIPRTCSQAFCQKAGATLAILEGLGHRAAWHTVWNYDYGLPTKDSAKP